jgi:hypothetical protein
MTPRFARVTMILAWGVLVLAAPGTAQPADPFVGTWTLNLAKSKHSPGPPPKSTTVTYEAAGPGYKISVKTESASGPTGEWSYTTGLDGKDSPVTGNNPNADTMATKRIDAHTLESVSKKGGKVMMTSRIVVSKDGKTRTNTQTGTNAKGQTVNNVLVFEKM